MTTPNFRILSYKYYVVNGVGGVSGVGVAAVNSLTEVHKEMFQNTKLIQIQLIYH
jgi:hypothetical protein